MKRLSLKPNLEIGANFRMPILHRSGEPLMCDCVHSGAVGFLMRDCPNYGKVTAYPPRAMQPKPANVSPPHLSSTT
jgi:hypothetical protein